MPNLTLAHLEELVDYLAGREDFLCQPTHNCVYLKSWSDLFDYNKTYQDILVQQLNIHCDCQALSRGREKLLKSRNTKGRNISL